MLELFTTLLGGAVVVWNTYRVAQPGFLDRKWTPRTAVRFTLAVTAQFTAIACVIIGGMALCH